MDLRTFCPPPPFFLYALSTFSFHLRGWLDVDSISKKELGRGVEEDGIPPRVTRGSQPNAVQKKRKTKTQRERSKSAMQRESKVLGNKSRTRWGRRR